LENLYNRRKIADEVYFTSITDPKFKINRISVMFITNLSENAAVNAVIPRLLTKCNEDLSMAELNRRLAELYSASLSWSVFADGDYQLSEISMIVLNNKYALDGEDILKESARILLDCIFRPYFENGYFPEQSLELEKQNQMDDNDAEINNKTQYAYLKAYEEAFRGEPAEIRWGGKNEEVEAVTPEAALEAYRRMISETRIEIICVGESDFPGMDRIFSDAFGKIERRPGKFIPTKVSPAKTEPLRFTETLDIEQSKLVMFHKTTSRSRYPLMVLSSLYGGTESSKLFSIVREKMSLCYYCYSRLGYAKGFLTTECGVDEKNIGRAEAECLNQLEDIKKGSFTEEDINKCKLYIVNGLRSSVDTINGVSSKCLTGILYPDNAIPIDEMVNRVNAVTKEEIIEAANTLTPDTVFILRSDKEAAE